MLKAVSIKNFRGLNHVEIESASQVNLLVGDNGSGKTSVLEAMLLALSSQTEAAIRVRTYRGFEAAFSGTPESVERALWGDIFCNGNMSNPISVALDGDGVFNRSLQITRNAESETVLSFKSESSVNDGITFTWTNHRNENFSVRPKITNEGLKLPVAFQEKNLSFYFPATMNPNSVETAQRFSDISQSNNSENFLKLFKKEYKWIEDISIELTGSIPSLFVKTIKREHRIPLPSVSGGINRIMSILLAIYGNPNSVVLIDEIENGQHYSHHDGIWRLIFDFLDMANSQLFVTSHSKECIDSLFRVATGAKKNRVSLHQMEREKNNIYIRSFGGGDAVLALMHGEEIR